MRACLSRSQQAAAASFVPEPVTAARPVLGGQANARFGASVNPRTRRRDISGEA